MDPFAPPSDDTPPPVAAGRIDIARACVEGAQAFVRNLPALVGATILGFVAYLASVCTCVGPIIVLPVLFWGAYAMWLEAYDGRTSVSTLFAGFGKLGHVWPRAMGLGLLMVLVQSPVIALAVAVGLYSEANPGAIDPLLSAAVSQLVTIAWTLAVARLTLAPFALVERDEGPLQSIATSWEITRGQGLAVAALLLVDLLAMLPGQMITTAATTQLQASTGGATPAELLTFQGFTMFGALMTVAGMMFGMLVVTAGWRHLLPDQNEQPG